MRVHEYGRWIWLVGLFAAPHAFAAVVSIDTFSGPFVEGIDDNWERAWWNGTWLPTNADYTSPPNAQAFAIYVGDTCNRGCESAIWHGHGTSPTIALRDFAPDMDATKPWSLTCNVSGHNDGQRPDYFLGYWYCEFMINQFSGGTSKQDRKVYWTTANDRIWEQITFSTGGSTSGDDVIQLLMWVRWGPFAIPTVSDSYVVFDDLRLTYTPNNGDVTAPGQVLDLTATRGDGWIELTWQNPPDADFAGTIIRARTDHFPASRWDGDLVVNLPGSPGAQQSVLHQPVENEKSYYYAAYTYDNRTVPSASYRNYSQAATAEAPGPTTPTVNANIHLIAGLGWDVMNHGGAADPTFKGDASGPTGWDTATSTPSQDNKSAKLITTPTTGTKWREKYLTATPGLTMFFVWKPGQGMNASEFSDDRGRQGVWGRSAANVVEIDAANIRLKIAADSEYSMYNIRVPDGLTDIALHDSVDVANGGLGTQFATFTIDTNVWHRWWFQLDGNRDFKLYDLDNVVPREGPHLLASGRLGSIDGDERVTFGESSNSLSSGAQASDFLVDEVYLLNSFRDVSSVSFPYGADFDGDGDVDEEDLASFEACASGPEIPLTPGCESRDFDTDNDVDQTDFAVFQRCYSGANVPADPNCTGA